MVDIAKHLLKAETEEEIDDWIKNLHRVVVSKNYQLNYE